MLLACLCSLLYSGVQLFLWTIYKLKSPNTKLRSHFEALSSFFGGSSSLLQYFGLKITEKSESICTHRGAGGTNSVKETIRTPGPSVSPLTDSVCKNKHKNEPHSVFCKAETT